MSEDCSDPRLFLLDSLELSDCRIHFSSTPIVLLCGGQVPPLKNTADDPDPPITSLRHGIISTHLTFDIYRAEEIQDWNSDGVFKDLVSYELELASICSLVVIILESEGSLVELGAFSQQPDLSNKIIAICDSQYDKAISFINLGVLRFISEKKSSYVRYYPWNSGRSEETIPEIADVIVSDIKIELENLPQTQVLKIDRSSDIMVLIYELLRLFSALKENEIFEYLKTLGANISKIQLKGKLFLLMRFEIIKIQKYSDAVFYMEGKTQYHTIRLSLRDKSKPPINPTREKMQVLDFYKKNDAHRSRAIFQANRNPHVD